ncbi:MAG: AraC family transcriptional regulator [Calditrichia bacterium]
MKPASELRQLYTPIQPTVKQAAENVTYREYLPNEKLQSFIYCYWELKTTRVLKKNFNYRVVADGCIDIFFELNRPSENFVMGFCKKYTEFLLDNSFHHFGVRFLPTMFPQFFTVDASELSNRYEALEMVAPKTGHYISTILSAEQNGSQICKLLDAHFLNILADMDFNSDSRLYEAIHIILQKSGVLNVQTDLDTGISPRQLRRLFKYYIGDTAKTFSKVVRFQNILRAKPSTQSLKENKLFFDGGYYDQAHFIKEFKNFYGVTPGKAFGR